MGGRLYLKTLGTPELLGADGRAVRFKVRKHLALLIYLAVEHGWSHTRDALVELFWSGVDVERGRHSLSVALSVLRSVLGPESIQATNTQVRLMRGELSLDLDLLLRGALVGGPESPPVEIGRFLLDFEIDDAPAFQHWRDRLHSQLLPALQAAFLSLADDARRSGDMRRVLHCADRLLELDPLSEEGIRARMLAFAMQGDRVSALRAYEEWKAELTRQLGAEPSELLEAIATRLRRGTVDRSVAVQMPAVQADRWADRRFVGRAAEFRELVEAWEYTTQYSSRHVLLTGESGIGKSTLAMRFGASVALEGAAVARVQCFELEQRIAFGMIGALVTSLLDKPGAVATAPASLAEIARVVPKVRERFPNLPAPRRTEGETARVHFAEGTFALFDAIMDEQPLLLIVDDYPRSDEASLSVLHMLLRRAATDRLMVVLTGRPPESGEPAQVRRIREGVAYLPLQQMQLAPLTEEEGDSMLTGLLGGNGKDVAGPARRAILQAGRGNPMALDLLAQDWAAHGEAALAISLPAMSSDMPASALEAVGYDRLIERMIPDLAPKTRTALQLAAILGPRLNDLDCFDIAELTPAQTLAAMTDLVERRLLRDVGGRLEFTNELIRARLYLKIPSAARIRLHDGVANRLLVSLAVGESVPGLEIAWHCMRARRREEATPYLMSGAREAILHGAPDEAVRALSSALGHLKGRVRDEAAVLLAESYQEMGDWKGALACLEELPKGKKRGDELLDMARILEIESRRQLGEFSTAEANEVMAELTNTVRDNSFHPGARTLAALCTARLASQLRATAGLESLFPAIESVPTDGLELRSRTRLLLASAMTQHALRRNIDGLRATLASSQFLEDKGAADSNFVLLQTGLGVIGCIRGTYEEATLHFEKAFTAALRLANADLAATAAGNIALCYYRLGITEEQVKWARTTNRHSTSLHPGCHARVDAAGLGGLGCVLLGRTREVSLALGDLRKAKDRAASRWIYQSAVYYEADIHWLMGDRDQALKTVRDRDGMIQEAHVSGYEGRFARWSTIGLVQEGRASAALTLLQPFFLRLESLDVIDQAEILCCLEYLRRNGETIPSEVAVQARTALARLPLPCSVQFQRLGLLLPD